MVQVGGKSGGNCWPELGLRGRATISDSEKLNLVSTIGHLLEVQGSGLERMYS